jgi:hypothetical protein
VIKKVLVPSFRTFYPFFMCDPRHAVAHEGLRFCQNRRSQGQKQNHAYRMDITNRSIRSDRQGTDILIPRFHSNLNRGRCMRRNCYTVQRLDGEWVVLAAGSKILICQNKSTAIKAAKCAVNLLSHDWQQARRNEALRSRAGEAPGDEVAIETGAA